MFFTNEVENVHLFKAAEIGLPSLADERHSPPTHLNYLRTYFSDEVITYTV